jgi:hypothetical protein
VNKRDDRLFYYLVLLLVRLLLFEVLKLHIFIYPVDIF